MISILTTLALLLALAPAALAAEIPGQVYTTPNGDGATPFNLRWADTAKGIVSFEKQAKDVNYRLELYRDGTRVAGTTVGNRDGKATEEVNIADDMTQSGTYVFTLHRCDPPGTDVSAGLVAKSEPFVYTAPTAVQSAADFTEGTATYSYPDGAVKNPAGTVVTPPAPAAKTAYMREQAITIDGAAIAFQAYALKDEKGNETNYVKLRDVAAKLNGTSVQFNVGWDGAVNIEPGKAYVPNGTEMATPFTGDRAYTDATTPTNVSGAKSDLAAIVLNDDKGAGYTYYKLRDLGTALGFKVDWSADKGITVDTGAAAPAPVGKIEHPAVTDPSLTAPTGLKLEIGTRVEYGSDGRPVELPTTMPVIAWKNTAGERAGYWMIRLYDTNNKLLHNTHFSGNPKDLSYMLGEEEAGTIATIAVTPVDPGGGRMGEQCPRQR